MGGSTILLLFSRAGAGPPPAAAASIEEVVFALLSGDSQLADLVGGRISPDIRPQTKGLPAIRTEVSSEDGLQTLAGLTGDFEATVEIEAVAKDRLTCRRLANRIRRVLPSAEGTTVLGLRIKRVNFDAAESDFTALSNGADRPVRSMLSTFLIQYWDL